MSELLYADMKYCSLCDRYFPGDEARAEHVQVSPNHPKCTKCDRRFANMNSLRNHWVYSPRHHYCAACERDFKTAAGLRVHIEFAAVHRDDSDDDSEEDHMEDAHDGWEDDMGLSAFPEENDESGEDDSEAGDYSGEEEYWDEDDETEFEEVREAYYGFSIVIGSSLSSGGSSGAHSSSSDEADARASNDPGIARGHSRPEKAREKADPVGVLFNCPLCLEPPQESSATRCGHLFCTRCITHALSQKKLCPVCRKSATLRQLRKIYLST